MLRGDAVPLPRPLEAHRLRRPRLPALFAFAVTAASLAGCGGIERAGIAFLAGDGVGGRRRTLRSAVPAEKAELSLVRAALRLVAASGRVRPSVEGRAHFSAPVGVFYRLDLRRRDSRGHERWRLDGGWAVRELPGGAVLCWRGDLRLVVETLGGVLPATGRRFTGPGR